MKVLCRVNQAEAMRRGIDAPQSTVRIDVEPASLTEVERQVLAAVMIDGHDCTQRGVQTQTPEIEGQQWRIVGNGRVETYSNGAPTAPMVLVRPDLQGLRDAIAEMLAARDAAYAAYMVKEAAREARNAQEQAERDAKDRRVTDALLRGDAKFRDEDGQGGFDTTTSVYDDYVFVDCPCEWVANYRLARTPEIEPAITVYQARRDAWYEQRRVEAEAKAKADAEAEATKKAQDQAEWDALYARLPQAMRDRYEAGYAYRYEIERAMRVMIREDAGYPAHHDGWSKSVPLTSLTDAEFARLREAQAHAPTGATVEPRECWDDDYREADEDEMDEADDDGMVHHRERIRRQIVVTWHCAGMPVESVLPLTD